MDDLFSWLFSAGKLEHDRGFLPVEAVATKLHGVCAAVKSTNSDRLDRDIIKKSECFAVEKDIIYRPVNR